MQFNIKDKSIAKMDKRQDNAKITMEVEEWGSERKKEIQYTHYTK